MIKLVLGVTAGLVATVLALAITAATALLSEHHTNHPQPSPEARSDIPADYLAHYQHAAPVCPGLDWSVLAAIGKIETNHGRLDAPGVHSGENFAGAGVISRYVAA